MSIAWEQFGWTSGGDRYSFTIVDNGLYGTLQASGRPDVTLPMVAWEGMLEAVRANRKAKSKEHAALPPRAGALWSAAESDQLAAAYQSGASVEKLALTHSRTRGAVERQLEKLGLIEARYQGGAGPPHAAAAPRAGPTSSRHPA